MVSPVSKSAERFSLASLGELLPKLAHTLPQKVALITQSRELTFEELNQESSGLASSLVEQGLKAGERVALYSSNRWEWIVAYHAVLKTGAVVLPINVMCTPDEIRYILNDAQASMLIASSDRLDAVQNVLDEVPTLNTTICFDGATPGALSFAELSLRDSSDFVPVEVDPASLACIAYTSGTTGRPKGAMQSNRSLVLNCAYTATMHARTSEDLVVTALPSPHVYGNVVINSTFLVGGTVALLERFSVEETLELIAERKATLFEGVPTMYAMLISSPLFEDADLSSLTRSTVGGQTIAESVIESWERASGAPLLELWGMTELSGLGATHPLFAPNVHGSIGVALPGTELKVADPEDVTIEQAPGVPGELMARGPLVTMGYFNNPQATAEAIEADGWFHTGDVATHDGIGHFFVVDRLKDVILTGGYNVYPAEIERVIIGHEDVSLVAVAGEPDEVKGEVAHAYVVLRSDASVTEQQLIEYCRGSLAAYKLPRGVHFVDSLPTTSSGKLMRRKLRELRI